MPSRRGTDSLAPLYLWDSTGKLQCVGWALFPVGIGTHFRSSRQCLSRESVLVDTGKGMFLQGFSGPNFCERVGWPGSAILRVRSPAGYRARRDSRARTTFREAQFIRAEGAFDRASSRRRFAPGAYYALTAETEESKHYRRIT